jgi:hypothetical protein
MTSNAELERIAATAAKKAVDETFMKLGLDTSDPIKAQRDFAILSEARKLLDDEDFRADLTHLRKWRLAMDKAQSQTLIVMITLIITGIVTAFWLGFKSQVFKP